MMRPRDFALLVLICIVWAYNNVLSKVVVSDWQIPPLYYSAARFLLVAIVTLPWLLPLPRPFSRIAWIAFLMGAINFGLLFMGLKWVSPSMAAIVLQSTVPFTALLSIAMLGERIHWWRGTGIALTLIGLLIVLWKPGQFHFSWGILLVLGAAFGSSLGAVLIKQTEKIEPLRFQAWVATLSIPPLALASLVIETGQWQASTAVAWPLVGAVLYSALVVSVFGHTCFYWLIRRYDANLIAPLTLLNPLFTFGLGILFTGDVFDLPMAIGSAVVLIGVLIIAMRPRSTAALMLEREQS